MEKLGIGIIGCGNISSAYLKAMAAFPILDIRGIADLNRSLAEERAAEFKVEARNVADLLADPSIELIVNLTVPKAHVTVAMQALEAGKHTYSESRSPPISQTGASWWRWLARRACGSAPPPTPSSAARIRRRAQSSVPACSARPSAAPPPSCAPATSAGIQIRTSITTSAAGRCSTWVPTTSQTSSTSLARSPRLPASPRRPGRSGPYQ